MSLLKIKEDFLNKWWYPVRFWILHKFKKTKFKLEYDKILDREVTFSDDFDDNNLDREVWNTSFPWGRNDGSSKNNYYKTDGHNIDIENGIAQFYIKNEQGIYNHWDGEHHYKYTCAHIDTKDRFEQAFGRWDVKIKFPDKEGHWPAVWLLTQTWEHPEAPGNNGKHEVILPEVDVFEQFGKGRGNMRFTLHTGLTYRKPWHRMIGNGLKHINFGDNWWLLSFEWTDKTLVWKLNGIVVKKIYQKCLGNHERLHRPAYIIISNATSNGKSGPKDEVSKCMAIDWVRIYK